MKASRLTELTLIGFAVFYLVAAIVTGVIKDRIDQNQDRYDIGTHGAPRPEWERGFID